VETRLAGVQSELQRSATDLLVVGPSANLRYLVGYQATAVERLTVLLVTPSSAAMILPDFDDDEFRALTRFPGSVHPWADNRGPVMAVDEAFRVLGELPSGGRVLIDDELPYRFLRELEPRLGQAQLAPASELLGPMRMRKSADEVTCLEAAGDVVSRAMDRALDFIEPGQPEQVVAEEIRRFLIDLGAESADYVLVQAGDSSAAAHHVPGARQIHVGEPVLVDIAARVDGYFADTTQQVFIGHPSDEYCGAYEAVAAAHAEALRIARPGIEIEEIDTCSSDVLEQRGYPREARTGHGIGLDVHEPPYLVAGDHTVLEPGMVFTIEPGVYLPGRFGVRIEDTVLVRDRGVRALTTAGRPLVVKR
jgi:Xaa-Pro aminopeptidase